MATTTESVVLLRKLLRFTYMTIKDKLNAEGLHCGDGGGLFVLSFFLSSCAGVNVFPPSFVFTFHIFNTAFFYCFFYPVCCI
jgi:predicted membrane chloride channel (bestrophin family)